MLLLLLLFVARSLRDRQAAIQEKLETENRFQGICEGVARARVHSLTPVEDCEPWQMVMEEKVAIFPYSAVLHRRDLGRRSIQEVKVVALGSDPRFFTPYCQLWYPEEFSPRFTQATFMSTGPPMASIESSSFQYHQYVITCSLAITDRLPTHVSIVTEECEDPENFVEIFSPSMAGISHEFGVCVPAATGVWDPVHTVEWVEVHRMLGVTNFQIYNTALTDTTVSSLQHYTDKGIVQIIPIPTLKVEFDKYDAFLTAPKELLDTVSLTDCLLKNMYRTRNLIVADFNDIIVPRHVNNYKDMLHKISQDIGVLGDIPNCFVFHHATFGTNCEAQNKGKSNYFRYYKRSEVSRSKAKTPFVLDPSNCMVLSREGCRGSGRSGLSFAWNVQPQVALAHHYKSPENDLCDADVKENGGVVQDDALAKFRYRILAASPIGLDGWLNL